MGAAVGDKMNSKLASDLRYNLSKGVVKEGYLCRKFGYPVLDDIPDELYAECRQYAYDLNARVRKDRRASKGKNRTKVGQYAENADYFKFDYNTNRV